MAHKVRKQRISKTLSPTQAALEAARKIQSAANDVILLGSQICDVDTNDFKDRDRVPYQIGRSFQRLVNYSATSSRA